MAILTASIALNGTPAFAGGLGDFFYRLFHSVMPQENSRYRPSPVPSPSLSPSLPTPLSNESTAPSIPVTSDSSYQVPGTVPENARWLAVSAKKDGKEVSFTYISATPGAPLPTVHLSDGPGIYTVTLYKSGGIRVTDEQVRSFKTIQVQNEDTRDHQNLLPSLAVQSDAPEIVALAQQLTEGLQTDREKAYAIFHWIAKTIEYDEVGQKDKSYTAKSLDALTVLQSKLTVCEGYSNLYAALLRAVGIRSKVIIGKAFTHGRPSDVSPAQVCEKDDESRWYGHAWNAVYVDNRWILVDSTLAALYNGAEGTINDNFDRKEDEFSYSHQKCEESGR
jgi:transglutaminase-like putative cysteine protease